MSYKSLLCAAAMLAASGVAQAFPDYSWNPQSGGELSNATLLSTINLKMPSASSIVIAEPNASYLLSEDGDKVYCTSTLDSSNLEKGTVVFKFGDITVNGEWTLYVPAGTLTVDGEANETLKASWTLSDPDLVQYDFPQISLESINPADGSKLYAWGGDNVTKVTIKTSDDDAVNYIGWELYQLMENESGETVAEYVRSGSECRVDINRSGDFDQWTDGLFFSVAGNDRLVLGRKYRLTLTFCGIGYNENGYPSPKQIAASTELVTSVEYEGLTPLPDYAEAEYVGVSPNPSEYTITSVDQAVFDVIYSAPATPVAFTYPLGSGAGLATAGTYAVAEGYEQDGDGLATRWTFTFNESVVKDAEGTLTCNVQSKDGDGRYVKGNANIEFEDYNYNIVWKCNVNAPALTSVSPAANTTVESLSSITISNSGNKIMELSYAAGRAEIRTKTGGEVLTLGDPTLSSDGKQATWTFDPITESGAYVLIIPENYFWLGGQENGVISNIGTFEYYVENSVVDATDLLPTSILPEEGNVPWLYEIKLTFADVTYVALEDAPSIIVNKYEGPGANYYMTINPGEALTENDWFNPTEYTLLFNELPDGKYDFVFPEGLFYDADYDPYWDGSEGKTSPEFTLTYIVGDESSSDGVVYDIEPESVYPGYYSEVTSIKDVVITFSEPTFYPMDGSAPKIQLIKFDDSGDEQVAQELDVTDPDQVECDDYWNPTVYTLHFKEVTEPGFYQVYIPMGVFCDEEYDVEEGESGHANDEIYISYTIVDSQDTPSTAVSYTFVPASVTPGNWDWMESLETVIVEYGAEGIYAVLYDEAYYAKLYKTEYVVPEGGNWPVEVTTLVATAPIVENDPFNPTGGTYTFSPAITEAGNYILVIPQGAFGDDDYTASLMNGTSDGIASKVIEINYILTGVSEPLEPAEYSITAVNVTPSDNSHLDSLATVTVELSDVAFPYQVVEDFSASFAKASLYKVTSDGDVLVESVEPWDNINSNFWYPTIYDFNFNEITENGEYKVVIPQGTFGDDAYLESYGEYGKANEEIVITYIVGEASGVKTILDGAETITVYDVNGVLILKDADVEAAKELKSGLYIINGKKVMIRK